jgi:hypothetical protein
MVAFYLDFIMSLDAYSVAIRISLTNMVSQGLLAMSKDLLGVERQVVNLQDKFSALKTIAAGWGVSHIGNGMLSAMEKSVDASKEYTRQLSLMRAAGMSNLEVANATGSAWKTSRDVITSTAAQNLESIRELRSAFGPDAEHMKEVYAVLPIAMRTRAILESLTGKEQGNVGFDMAKAVELKTPGVMTVEAMQRNMELMSKTLMAMGGTLNANDFHMAIKQSKTAAFGASDDFVYNYLPTLMQEVKSKVGGAQSAGTAWMTAYRAVIQGIIKKSSIPVWESLGLISGNDVVKNSTGAMQLKPGAVKGAQLFQENPYVWAQTVLGPAVESYGKAHNLNREQTLSAMFGDRNAQWFFNTLLAKAPQFERDKKLVNSTNDSFTAYQELLKTNPQIADMAMRAQWSNIQAQIGFQILPKLIPVMIKFANALSSISDWADKNPGTFKDVVLGFTGIGVALSVIGKIMMTAGLIKFLGLGEMLGSVVAMLGGPVVWTFIAVAAAGALIYKNWDKIGPILKNMWSDFKGIMSDIWGRVKQVGAYIKNWKLWDYFIPAFRAFEQKFVAGWNALFDWIVSILNKLPGISILNTGQSLAKGKSDQLLTDIASITGGKGVNPSPGMIPGTIPPTAQQQALIDNYKNQGKSTESYSQQYVKGMQGSTYQAPVPGKPSQPVVLTVNSILDGKKVGEGTMKYWIKELTKQPSNTSGFDSNMLMLSPGATSNQFPR